jgi:hypothetical protein
MALMSGASLACRPWANLRANVTTYAAAMPTTPTGSVGPNLGASNYGNGVQKFSGQGIVASGPKAPQGVPAVAPTE